MPVTLTICVVVFATLYLRRLSANVLAEAVNLGLMWFTISVVIDLAMFMWGLMAMSFVDYILDIGLTYLIYPIVTIGFGYVMEQRPQHLGA